MKNPKIESGWIDRFDVLPIASWLSVGALLVTQTALLRAEHLQYVWAISSVGLASCLALSELRIQRAKSKIQTLRAASTVDPLTGVGNRRWLDIELKQRIAQLRRQGAPFSVLMLDIDHFKSVNDNWGHDAGDLILVAVANEIRRTLRDSDVLCRIGGEEFVAVLPGTNVKFAVAAAERIRLAVEQTATHYKDRILKVTISIGVTEATSEGDIEELLKRADDALYAAKRTGRNLCFVKTSTTTGCVDIRNKVLLDQLEFAQPQIA